MKSTFKINKKLNMEETIVKDIKARDLLYDTAQIVRLTGFSYQAIKHDMDEGRLPFRIVGKTRYVHKKDLKDYIQ